MFNDATNVLKQKVKLGVDFDKWGLIKKVGVDFENWGLIRKSGVDFTEMGVDNKVGGRNGNQTHQTLRRAHRHIAFPSVQFVTTCIVELLFTIFLAWFDGTRITKLPEKKKHVILYCSYSCERVTRVTSSYNYQIRIYRDIVFRKCIRNCYKYIGYFLKKALCRCRAKAALI